MAGTGATAGLCKRVKQDENQHIQVAVRVRPLNKNEKGRGSSSLHWYPDRCQITAHDKNYRFDKVFGPESRQLDIYQQIVCPHIDEVLQGYNCTIFAYGQTGSGKTFTMEGERSDDPTVSWENEPLAGVIPRTLHQMFDCLSKQTSEFSVRVSFVELYNEELFDLLTGPEDTTRLRLYEHPCKKGSVVIQGLSEVVVHNKDEVYGLLEKGAKKRSIAATLLNAASSRSHSVFSVTVHIRENTLEGEELLKTGKIYLVDLAGSENIGKSGSVDERAREAGMINQSLLTLGRVITALTEQTPHVPYRESKLTRLLQDSLGGKTKTSIIATISPASSNMEETLNTLQYALRAKSITNRPEVNQRMTKRALIKEYTEEIERLRKDLQATREKNGVILAEENYNAMQAKILGQDDAIRELQDKIEILEKQSAESIAMFDTTKKELGKLTGQYNKKAEQFQLAHEKYLSAKKDQIRLKQELAEAEYVNERRETHISVLSSQASQLIATSEQATIDNEKLQEKLQRTAVIEKRNVQNLQEMRKAAGDGVNNVLNQLDNLLECSVQSQTRAEGVIEDIHSCTVESRRQCEFEKDTFVKVLGGSCEKVVTNLNQFHEKSYGYFSDLNKLTSVIKSKQKATSSGIEEFSRTATTRNSSAATSVVDLVNSSCGKIDNEIREGAKAQRERLTNFEGLEQGQVLRRESTLGKILKKLNAIASTQAAAAKKLEDAVMEQKLLADGISEIVEDVSAVLAEEKPNFSEITEQFQHICSANDKQEAEILSITANMLGSTQAQLKDLQTKLKENQETIDAMLSDAEATILDSADEIGQVTDKTKVFVMDHKSTLFGEMHELRNAFNSHATQLTGLYAGWDGKVSELLQKEKQELETDAQKIKNWIATVDLQTKALGLEVNACLDEKIQFDVSTGQTPCRKDYTFPRRVVEATPKARVITRFREQYAPDQLSDTLLEHPIFEDSLLESSALTASADTSTASEEMNHSSVRTETRKPTANKENLKPPQPSKRVGLTKPRKNSK